VVEWGLDGLAPARSVRTVTITENWWSTLLLMGLILLF
jgi:hypothetical protein